MNPSMKIIRPKVEEKYEALFTFLYTADSKNVKNQRNTEAMKKLMNQK